MKNLNKIFYDILYKLDKNNFSSFHERLDLLNKYFFNNKKNNEQNTINWPNIWINLMIFVLI